MLLRVAGTTVPDPAEPSGWRRIPEFRAHGAMRSLMVLDALWWFAVDQRSGTARTGTSTLAWLMAPLCGWKKLPAERMIDAHGKTIRLHARRLADAGLVLAEVAQDDYLQDRATDWLLMPAAADLTDEELAAADEVIAKYRRRHPDLERARKKSAARLAGQWRAFLTSLGRRPERQRSQEKNQSPSLPSGLACGQAQDQRLGLSSHRARAHVDQASPEEFTRLSTTPPPTSQPRPNLAVDEISEGAGAGSRRQRERHRDAERRDDLEIGRLVLKNARLALPEHLRDIGGVSTRRTAHLAALARRAERRLGMTPEDVARALAWIVVHRGVELHQAVREFGADLDRPDVLPAEVFQHLQATRAEKNRRRHERIADAAAEAAKQLPAFIRLDPLTGRPMTWTQPDRPTLAAPSWLRCHTVPDDETLNDPEVRRQIHAAAALAGITGPQRVARAIETGEYDRMLKHHADIEAYKREVQGNGSVLLIGLDNARATVPPAWSDAPASRWTYDEPAPTREQLDVYAWLARDRKAAGLYTPPAPATAREISAAIEALRATE